MKKNNGGTYEVLRDGIKICWDVEPRNSVLFYSFGDVRDIAEAIRWIQLNGLVEVRNQSVSQPEGSPFDLVEKDIWFKVGGKKHIIIDKQEYEEVSQPEKEVENNTEECIRFAKLGMKDMEEWQIANGNLKEEIFDQLYEILKPYHKEMENYVDTLKRVLSERSFNKKELERIAIHYNYYACNFPVCNLDIPVREKVERLLSSER